MEKTHDLRILDCYICEHQSTKKSSLVDHVEIDHKRNFTYEHQDLECNHRGTSLNSLQIASLGHHYHNFHVECILQCKKCEERSQTDDPIREHIRVTYKHFHINHACGLCESKTNERNHLNACSPQRNP